MNDTHHDPHANRSDSNAFVFRPLGFLPEARVA